MKRSKIYKLLTVASLLVIAASSCTEKWDEYYKTSTATELNLTEYINSKDNLSTFAQMLKISGMDTVLNKPQTFTVWAPVNSALESIQLTDTNLVIEIVKNHISRFSFPTSNLQSKVIYMLDKKFLVFKRMDTDQAQFSFGNKMLLNDFSNVAASNGILHTIDGYVPYLSNLWEFIGKAPDLDSLRTYLFSQSKSVFDVAASVEIGTNQYGQAIYDSVIIFKNEILDKIGQLQLEDSAYTVLLPNNTAWTKAYDKVKSNYVTLPKDGGVPSQRLNTQWAIVRDLVFRKIIDNPANLDSLVTTTGSVFQNPPYLFEGATQKVLSNGYAYVTDSIRFKPTESWQQAIKLEAENSDYGRSYLYANLYVRSSLGSQYSTSVSNTKYLVVEPSTVSNSTMNTVTFPIPNTLSGKYNVYCVFLPSNIVSPTDNRVNKVKFYFSYLNNAGVQIVDAAVDAKNVVTIPNRISAIFNTTAGEITKMFVTQFTFPYCNILNDKSSSADITFKLRVENAVKITETVLFNQTMRIDYIVLEPVQ